MGIQGTARHAWDVLVIAVLMAVYVVALAVQTVVARATRLPATVRPAVANWRTRLVDQR